MDASSSAGRSSLIAGLVVLLAGLAAGAWLFREGRGWSGSGRRQRVVHHLDHRLEVLQRKLENLLEEARIRAEALVAQIRKGAVPSYGEREGRVRFRQGNLLDYEGDLQSSRPTWPEMAPGESLLQEEQGWVYLHKQILPDSLVRVPLFPTARSWWSRALNLKLEIVQIQLEERPFRKRQVMLAGDTGTDLYQAQYHQFLDRQSELQMVFVFRGKGLEPPWVARGAWIPLALWVVLVCGFVLLRKGGRFRIDLLWQLSLLLPLGTGLVLGLGLRLNPWLPLLGWLMFHLAFRSDRMRLVRDSGWFLLLLLVMVRGTQMFLGFQEFLPAGWLCWEPDQGAALLLQMLMAWEILAWVKRRGASWSSSLRSLSFLASGLLWWICLGAGDFDSLWWVWGGLVVLGGHLHRSLTRPFLHLGLSALMALIWMNARHEYLLRDYLSGQVAPVLQNQGNRGKLIARELIHELDVSYPDRGGLLRQASTTDLARLWKRTYAFRENVPSGIFLFGADRKPLTGFYQQLSFPELEGMRFFPFWAVMDGVTDRFGRASAVARATLAVHEGVKLLGYVVVEVLNNPDISGGADLKGLLGEDPKFRELPLAYMILDSRQMVVENPAGIALPSGGLPRKHTAWFSFAHHGMAYLAFVQPMGNDRLVVLAPRTGLFRRLADAAQIWGLGVLILVLARWPLWVRYPWRRWLRTLAFHLVLMMMGGILVGLASYALFSIRQQGSEKLRNTREWLQQRGQTALILLDQWDSRGLEPRSDDLFWMASILGGDVHLYRQGALVETSNYRKFLQNRLSSFLNKAWVKQVRERPDRMLLGVGASKSQILLRRQEWILQVDPPPNPPGERSFPGEDRPGDTLLVVLSLTFLVGGMAARWLRNRVMEPLTDLLGAMKGLREGAGAPGLNRYPQVWEFRRLYDGFNRMVKAIQDQKQVMAEMARMKTLVRMGRRIAHEVRNPLTPIRLSAEQIARVLRDGRAGGGEIIQRSVHYITEEVQHLEEVSRGFLDLSKMDELQVESFDLQKLIREECGFQGNGGGRVTIHIREQMERPFIIGDRTKWRQILANLLKNAREAMPEGGEISVSTREEGGMIELVVADRGQGLDPEMMTRAFEEDFSTKDRGSGLGLFITRRMVELHGGGITMEPRPGGGVCVRIRFPRQGGEA